MSDSAERAWTTIIRQGRVGGGGEVGDRVGEGTDTRKWATNLFDFEDCTHASNSSNYRR